MAGHLNARGRAAQRKAKQAFLDAFSKCGNVLRSCEAAGIGRATHYYWLEKDPDYVERYKIAETDAVDVLEKEAHRRAHDGLLRKKFTKSGEPIIDPETGEQYVEREYSDTLLIFLLKGLRPERYRERYEHSGPGGAPLAVGALKIEVIDSRAGRDN